MSKKLNRKPCPFCGGKDLVMDHAKANGKDIFWLQCSMCQTDGPTGVGTPAAARALWDRRVEL